MRILQICDTYPPDEGGLGAHVRRLATQLTNRGHEVAVIAAGKRLEGAPTTDGFPVRRVGMSLTHIPGAYEPTSPPFHPPWPDPKFVRGLREAIVEFNPEVVHAHGWCVHSAVSPRVGLSNHVVNTLHDYNLICPKKSLLRFGRECEKGRGANCLRCDDQSTLKRSGLATALAATTPRLTRRVRRFLAVSGYVARQAERAGVPRESIDVVPNFVDIPAANIPVGDELAHPARPYVMYAGPASPHKGRQVLLDAHRELSGDVALRLVGGDGTVSASGVEDIGYRSGDELAELYRHALLIVVPSIWADPCPTVALEAMANGKPVIASGTGGLTEIVDDGSTGLLVPPGNAAALRDAIGRLISDPALRKEMGARARERVVRFSTRTVLPEIESVYLKARETD